MAKTCAFAALFCILVAPVASAQSPMSRQEVLSAIALGRSGNPRPYEATFNGWTAGVVYTPFVRVALAARLARDAKRPFGLEDVRPWMTSPEVWVALRWYPRDAPGRDADLVTQAKAEHQRPAVLLKPTGWGGGLKPVDSRDPLWNKGPEALAPLGPLPFGDIVAVAAYPREALVPGHHIVVYYTLPSPTGTIVFPVREMVLLEGEVSTWR